MRLRDLTGNSYGRLTVVALADKVDGRSAWLCRCDCGAEKVVRDDHLKRSLVKSCGGHSASRQGPLTAAMLRDALDYNRDTGVFTARLTSGTRTAGDAAHGCKKDNGYFVIGVEGKQYYAHRLAWLHCYGEWPRNQIDHIDGNRANNAIENLRDVSRDVNMQNLRRATSVNVLGVLGVTPWHGGRYRASIGLNGQRYHLGLFATEAEAYAAYVAKKREIHEGCTL